MAKDPAFLFYASDFLTGTMFMTDEQVGVYIRMLCAQHQHGGRIDTNVLRTYCERITNGHTVFEKFEHDDRGSYSPRLEEEMERRAAKSLKASESVQVRWKKTKNKGVYERNTNVIRSETETETENRTNNKKESRTKKIKESKPELIYPFTGHRFTQLWSALTGEPKWKKKSVTALQMALQKLSRVSEEDACEMMEATIAGGWAGLFETSIQNNNGKTTSNNGTAPHRSGRVHHVTPEEAAAALHRLHQERDARAGGNA